MDDEDSGLKSQRLALPSSPRNQSKQLALAGTPEERLNDIKTAIFRLENTASHRRWDVLAGYPTRQSLRFNSETQAIELWVGPGLGAFKYAEIQLQFRRDGERTWLAYRSHIYPFAEHVAQHFRKFNVRAVVSSLLFLALTYGYILPNLVPNPWVRMAILVTQLCLDFGLPLLRISKMMKTGQELYPLMIAKVEATLQALPAAGGSSYR